LDTYLKNQASQDARRKVAAPFVMLDPTGAIVGYYTLSAYAVLLKELPDLMAKRMPRYPRLPGRFSRASRSASHAADGISGGCC
jgi:hypothetical protein